MTKERSKTLKKISAALKLFLLLLFVFAVPIYIGLFRRDLITRMDSIQEVTAFLDTNKTLAVFVYIGLQILQIIVSVLPGQIFQVAAGYYFGFFSGLVFSLTGAAIGTTLTYFVARLLGSNSVKILFGEERINKIVAMLNSHRAYNIVFLLYLIPGLPKDLVGYAAGISHINFKVFIILSIVGRTFGMSGSLLFGYLYAHKQYVLMGIVGVLAVLIFILCIIYRKKISDYMDRFYEKMD
ncbi:MAG: VTT domain-containing protein [Clostridiales bacterium]|nr:VTT domain-containing protein [Clostridiales bacterium]